MEEKKVLVIDGYIEKIRDSLNNLKTFSKSSDRKISEYEFKLIKKNFNRILYFASVCDFLEISNLASFGQPIIEDIRDSSLYVSEDLGGMLALLIQKIEVLLAKMWFAGDKNISKTEVSFDDFSEYFIKNKNSFAYRPQVRKLKFTKDDKQQIGINIPSNFIKRCKENDYLSIVIIDFLEYEKKYDALFSEFDKLTEENVLLLHGSLEIDNSDLFENGEEAWLPFYLLLKTDKPGSDFLKDKDIKPKIIRELYKPENTKYENDSVIEVNLPVVNTQNDFSIAANDKIEQVKSSLKNSVRLAVREEMQESVVNMVKDEFSEVVKSSVSQEVDRYINATKKKSRREIKKAQLGDKKIRFSIGTKLILFFTFIIVASLSSIGFIAITYFKDNITQTIEDSNQEISTVIASKVEDQLETIRGNAENLIIGSDKIIPGEQSKYIENYFGKNNSVVFVAIPDTEHEYYNRQILGQFGIADDNVKSTLSIFDAKIHEAENGVISIFNVSHHLGKPIIALAAPTYIIANKKAALVVYIDITNIFVNTIQSGSKSYTERFIVNDEGEIIVHADIDQMILNTSFVDRYIVQTFMESGGQGARFVQEEYKRNMLIDEEETEESIEISKSIIGSYNKIDFGQLAVITEFEQEKALAFLNFAIIIFILIMFLAVGILGLIVLFFSRSITDPLRELVFASRQIQEGNYDVELMPQHKDEVGVLTESFIEMGQGLKERERIKTAFGKFVNKDVAELAAKGEIKLGGEIKKATIFFSDIRSFTAISEKLEPDEVVEFLNEYMTRMVECVNKTHGVVDKYIGDAIMALWGTPISRGNDAENGVNGALLMRKALLEFNVGRGGDKKPIIKIGCGLNTGEVLVGQIGSSDRMEYTVIGDPVNLASRVESLNKAMGTDILISQETANEVKGIYRLVAMNEIMVKGKSKPQQIYAVLGRLDDPDSPKTLKELRELVGIEGDFDNVSKEDINKPEEKYEIIE